MKHSTDLGLGNAKGTGDRGLRPQRAYRLNGSKQAVPRMPSMNARLNRQIRHEWRGAQPGAQLGVAGEHNRNSGNQDRCPESNLLTHSEKQPLTTQSGAINELESNATKKEKSVTIK